MQLEIRSIHEKLPSVLLASIFAVFVLTLPRFTDTSKAWYFALIMFGFFYFLVYFKQLAHTTSRERLFFAVVILNFLWMAFSFYLNGEPGPGASFLWGRHFYFLFLIPLFFLFRKISISDNIVLLSLFFSVLISIVDIVIDLAQGIDHRVQGMNPNSFGPIQLCIAGMLLFFFIHKSQRWQRTLALIGFLMAIATVLFSQSKGTWIAIPVLTVFFVFYMAHSLSNVKKVIAIIAIFAILSSSYFLPIVKPRIDTMLGTISAYLSSDDYRDDSRIGTFGTRVELWKTGWNIFLENPATGAGLGSFKLKARENWERYQVNEVVGQFKYVHNQYIAALATRGIPGLALLLMVLFMPLYIAMTHKPTNQDTEIARHSIIFICLTYIIGNIIEDHFEGKSTTMFVGTFLPLLMAKISPGNTNQAL